jgi:alkylation response protein AidB-like acyl-CoA dehydrogenase
MEPTLRTNANETLQTLPGDEVRRVMWRFQDRRDLQGLVQSARGVARGPVARLVGQGGRNTQEWTIEKRALLEAFDGAGITTASLEPESGGVVAGPKNLVLALVAFELAWVDAGAAGGSQAHHLALAPVHERGTDEQRRELFAKAAGDGGRPARGAFCLTEPIPYAGAETGLLSGKVRLAEWSEGEEPILQVDKRGRFITNMGFADFVAVAVDTGDPRIKSSCMVIVEKSDPGLFNRGQSTRKLVQQLSSTHDPVFSLRVPASRIVGGYTVKDGAIVPRFTHTEILEAVFRRARVTVGAMTAAKLLSAVEPVLRYQRERFRGADPWRFRRQGCSTNWTFSSGASRPSWPRRASRAVPPSCASSGRCRRMPSPAWPSRSGPRGCATKNSSSGSPRTTSCVS